MAWSDHGRPGSASCAAPEQGAKPACVAKARARPATRIAGASAVATPAATEPHPNPADDQNARLADLQRQLAALTARVEQQPAAEPVKRKGLRRR